MVALTGPRQVGKTALMYQMVSQLLSEGNAPERLLYFSFDYPGVQTEPADLVSALLEEYRASVLQVPWSQVPHPVYIFLDEVTRVRDWHRVLKGWYDRQLPARWVFSDSSQTQVVQGLACSLVGRAVLLRTLPLTFRESVSITRPTLAWGTPPSTPLLNVISHSVSNDKGSSLHSSFQSVQRRLDAHAEEVELALRQYVVRGGLPGIQSLPSDEEVAARLRDYLFLTISKDLLPYVELRSARAIEKIAKLLADATSQRVELLKLARTVGISAEAARHYVEHLESLSVVSSSQVWSASLSARMRKTRKFHFVDHGLANAVSNRLSKELWDVPEVLGHIVETIVHRHLLTWTQPPGARPPEICYWTDAEGREVDLVVPIGRQMLPIRVKYQRTPSGTDLAPLYEFLELKESAPFAMLVTRDELHLDDRILKVPLPVLLWST